MDAGAKLDLFSRTVENRFVVSLFDLLLCGVIVLVIVRGWRGSAPTARRGASRLFAGFLFLGASFAASAVHSGILLFFEKRVFDGAFDVAASLSQSLAWILLAASAAARPARDGTSPAIPRRRIVPVIAVMGMLSVIAFGILRFPLAFEIANLILAGATVILFHRRPLDSRNLGSIGMVLVLITLLFRLAGALIPAPALWIFEQLSWTASLFVFAFAIGETSSDLFDKVFARLQVVFVLLASVMILMITQTETADYLRSMRGRSDPLQQFVGAHIAYMEARGIPLASAIDHDDLRRRVALGFANLPELKLIRIARRGKIAAIEIDRDRLIRQRVESAGAPAPDPDNYFLIRSLPLHGGGHDVVEFYGFRSFLTRHLRTRILLMFSLFTVMVVLSTAMIAFVVGGAGRTIRVQAKEIEAQQERLFQASRLAAVGELAAGVAHEVNNPATTILARASFLLSADETRSEGDREDLQAIVDQSERIAQITRSLLMFSRPQRLQIRPVAVERLVRGSLRSVERLLCANGVVVQTILPPSLPPVLADESSMSRALENIIRNAIDAMPEGGILRVGVRHEPGSGVCIEIADTGVGIDAERLPRLFDPFFTTKEPGKGTGLGLSIAHGIITEHCGRITVESKLGKGSRFTMVLPAEQSA